MLCQQLLFSSDWGACRSKPAKGKHHNSFWSSEHNLFTSLCYRHSRWCDRDKKAWVLHISFATTEDRDQSSSWGCRDQLVRDVRTNFFFRLNPISQSGQYLKKAGPHQGSLKRELLRVNIVSSMNTILDSFLEACPSLLCLRSLKNSTQCFILRGGWLSLLFLILFLFGTLIFSS